MFPYLVELIHLHFWLQLYSYKDWQVGGRGGVGTGSRHWCLAGSDAVHMEAIAATSWVYSVV